MKNCALLLILVALTSSCLSDPAESKFMAGDWDLAFALEDPEFQFQTQVYFQDNVMIPLAKNQYNDLLKLFIQRFPQKGFLEHHGIDGFLYEEEAGHPMILTLRLSAETDKGRAVPLALEFHSQASAARTPVGKKAYTATPQVLHSCVARKGCADCQIPMPNPGTLKAKAVGCSCDSAETEEAGCNHTITTTGA